MYFPSNSSHGLRHFEENHRSIDDCSCTVDRAKPVVVVVDDNIDSLILISYLLESFPCSSFYETEGNAALELCTKLNPDLILLDIRLPGLDGIQIAQRLRSQPATSQTPMIAITALTDAASKQDITAAGFDHYVSKPYMLDQVESLLQTYFVVSTKVS